MVVLSTLHRLNNWVSVIVNTPHYSLEIESRPVRLVVVLGQMAEVRAALDSR